MLKETDGGHAQTDRRTDRQTDKETDGGLKLAAPLIAISLTLNLFLRTNTKLLSFLKILVASSGLYFHVLIFL